MKKLDVFFLFLLLFASLCCAPHCHAYRQTTHGASTKGDLTARGKVRHDPFVVNTIPKAGTHLIMDTIYYMTNKHVDEAYEYITADRFHERALSYLNFLQSLKNAPYIHKTHVPYFPAMEDVLLQAGLKWIFFIRDPRDALVSLVFYMEKFTGERRDFMNVNTPVYSKLTLNERINAVMTGSCCTNYLQKFYKAFMGWYRSPHSFVARFEDLIGPQGGGSTARQENLIAQMGAFLKIKLTKSDIQAIAAYSNHHKGTSFQTVLGQRYIQSQIGSWKLYFDESNKALFKKLFGNELIELGYENNNNW